MIEKCELCRAILQTRHSTAEKPHHYWECGLGNVYLINVEVFYCPQCEGDSAAIPAIIDLHGMIAAALLRSHEPLTGGEFCYLRKNMTMRLSEMADRMKVSPEVIKNFERSETQSLRPPITCRWNEIEKCWVGEG
jgi:DNA-binding transcriptional regulator YiaG